MYYLEWEWFWGLMGPPCYELNFDRTHLSKAGRIWKEGSCCWFSLVCFRDMAGTKSLSFSRGLGYKKCGLLLNGLMQFIGHGNDGIGSASNKLENIPLWLWVCHLQRGRNVILNKWVSNNILIFNENVINMTKINTNPITSAFYRWANHVSISKIVWSPNRRIPQGIRECFLAGIANALALRSLSLHARVNVMALMAWVVPSWLRIVNVMLTSNTKYHTRKDCISAFHSLENTWVNTHFMHWSLTWVEIQYNVLVTSLKISCV